MADEFPVQQRLSRRALLVSALALAVPAYLQTNESFRPMDERVGLSAQTPASSFVLESPESLFLELALTVRAPGAARPSVVVDLNGTEAARIQADALYVARGERILLPFRAVRPGENRLSASIDDPSATFELTGRLQNYRGINPRFPRAFVVSDEAVAVRSGRQSSVQRVWRFLTFYVLSLTVVWAIGRSAARCSAPWRHAFAGSPSVVLWGALIYGIATPLHIWLPLEGLATAILVPVFIATFVRWLQSRRTVVIRFAIVTLVTLVALEVALRLFNAVSPSFVFYSDSYSRYRGQPGASFLGFALNSRGFHDVEHPLVRGSGAASRIVAIGDSFAFGVVPYEANYLTRLETELGGVGPVEVVNMGIAAAEPQDYLAVLGREGLAYDPDLVMVSFFVGNDFEDAERQLYEYSYVATFAHFLAALWRASPAGGLPGSGAAAYDDDQPTFGEERFLEIEVDRSWVYDPDETRLAPAAERAVGYLREMRDVSRRAGADFVVVLIPDEVQVDDGIQQQVARARGWNRDRVDFRRPNRLLVAALEQEVIPVLDLLPAFEEAGREARLYKPMDTHWNRAGNRLAAERIALFLRERMR